MALEQKSNRSEAEIAAHVGELLSSVRQFIDTGEYEKAQAAINALDTLENEDELTKKQSTRLAQLRQELNTVQAESVTTHNRPEQIITPDEADKLASNLEQLVAQGEADEYVDAPNIQRIVQVLEQLRTARAAGNLNQGTLTTFEDLELRAVALIQAEALLFITLRLSDLRNRRNQILNSTGDEQQRWINATVVELADIEEQLELIRRVNPSFQLSPEQQKQYEGLRSRLAPLLPEQTDTVVNTEQPLPENVVQAQVDADRALNELTGARNLTDQIRLFVEFHNRVLALETALAPIDVRTIREYDLEQITVLRRQLPFERRQVNLAINDRVAAIADQIIIGIDQNQTLPPQNLIDELNQLVNLTIRDTRQAQVFQLNSAEIQQARALQLTLNEDVADRVALLNTRIERFIRENSGSTEKNAEQQRIYTRAERLVATLEKNLQAIIQNPAHQIRINFTGQEAFTATNLADAIVQLQQLLDQVPVGFSGGDVPALRQRLAQLRTNEKPIVAEPTLVLRPGNEREGNTGLRQFLQTLNEIENRLGTDPNFDPRQPIWQRTNTVRDTVEQVDATVYITRENAVWLAQLNGEQAEEVAQVLHAITERIAVINRIDLATWRRNVEATPWYVAVTTQINTPIAPNADTATIQTRLTTAEQALRNFNNGIQALATTPDNVNGRPLVEAYVEDLRNQLQAIITELQRELNPESQQSKEEEAAFDAFLTEIIRVRNEMQTINPLAETWQYNFVVRVNGVATTTTNRVNLRNYIDRMVVRFGPRLTFNHQELIREVQTLIDRRIEELNQVELTQWTATIEAMPWMVDIIALINTDVTTIAAYPQYRDLYRRVAAALAQFDTNAAANMGPQRTTERVNYFARRRTQLDVLRGDLERRQQTLWEADIATRAWIVEAARIAALNVAAMDEPTVRATVITAERALQDFQLEEQRLRTADPLTQTQLDYLHNRRTALERTFNEIRERIKRFDNDPARKNQMEIAHSIDYFLDKRNIPKRRDRAEFADLHVYLEVIGQSLYDVAAVTMVNELLDSTDDVRTVSYKKSPFAGPAKRFHLLGATLIYQRSTEIGVYNFDSFLDQFELYFTDPHESHEVHEFIERFKKQFKEISLWHNRAQIRRANEDPAGPDGAFKALSTLQSESELSPDMKDLFNLTHESTEVEKKFNEGLQFSMGLWSVMSLKQYERQRLWAHVDPRIKKYFEVKKLNKQEYYLIKKEYDLVPRYKGTGVAMTQMIEDMLTDIQALGLTRKQAILVYQVGENYRIGAGLEAFLDAEYKFNYATPEDNKKVGVSVKAVEGEPKAANIGLYVNSARGNEVRPEFNAVFGEYLVHGYIPYSRAAQFNYTGAIQIGEYEDGRASLAEILSVKDGANNIDWQTRSTNPDKIIQAAATQAVRFLWPSASVKEAITSKHSFFLDVQNGLQLLKNALLSRQDEITPLRNYFLSTTALEKWSARLVLGFTKPSIDTYETLGFRTDSAPISGDRDTHLRSLYKDSRDYWLAAFMPDIKTYPYDFVRSMKYMFSRDDVPGGMVNEKVAIAFKTAKTVMDNNKISPTATDAERANAIKNQAAWVVETFNPWMTAYLTYDVLMRSVFALLEPNVKAIQDLQRVNLSSKEGRQRVIEIYKRLEFRVMDSYLIKTLAGTNVLNISQVNALINQANLLQLHFPGETQKFSSVGYKLYYDGSAKDQQGVLFDHNDLLRLANEFHLGEGYKFILQKGAKDEYFMQLQRIEGHPPTIQYFCDRLVLLLFMFGQDKIKVGGGK